MVLQIKGNNQFISLVSCIMVCSWFSSAAKAHCWLFFFFNLLFISTYRFSLQSYFLAYWSLACTSFVGLFHPMRRAWHLRSLDFSSFFANPVFKLVEASLSSSLLQWYLIPICWELCSASIQGINNGFTIVLQGKSLLHSCQLDFVLSIFTLSAGWSTLVFEPPPCC